MNLLKAQIEQAMEASAAALRDAERARQESAQRRAQVAWAGGRIAQLEGVLVASKLGIPSPLKPPPAAPSAAPPPAQVAAPNPLGSSAVAGGVMQRLTSTEAALEVSQAETVQLRKQLEAAQRALETQSQLSSGGARRSRSAHDLAGAAAATSAGGTGLAAELARERQRADTAERAARAAAEAVRRLTEDLEEKQQEVDEALASAEAATSASDAQLPAANGGDAHSDAVRAAAVALRSALVAERERSKALETELGTARNAAAAAEQRAQSAIAAAATAAASAAVVMSASNGASRGSKSGPGAFSGEEAYADERGPPELHSPLLAMPMEPRGRRGSATGRGGDAERRAAVAEEAAEAAEAKATRLRDALAEEKRAADALRAQLLARAGEAPERSAAAGGAGDAAARKRAKDAESALAAERERRAAAEARVRAAEADSEELVKQLAAARLTAQRAAESAQSSSSSADADRIAQLERTLAREREAAARALAEARAAASSGGSGAAAAAVMDADDIGPARALMAERQRSAQLSAQLSEVTARLARSAVSGGSPAPAAQQSPGVANELARLQARCRSLQEALDNSEARGCELEQELAEARAPRSTSRFASANPSPILSPVPFPDE